MRLSSLIGVELAEAFAEALGVRSAEQFAECLAVLLSRGFSFDPLLFRGGEVVPDLFQLGSVLNALSRGLFRLPFLFLL